MLCCFAGRAVPLPPSRTGFAGPSYAQSTARPPCAADPARRPAAARTFDRHVEAIGGGSAGPCNDPRLAR